MADLVLRPLTLADRGAWAALRHALWPHHPVAELSADLDDMQGDGFCNLGVFAGDELIGFAEAGIRPWGDGCDTAPVAWLEGIYVAPGARRQGIGRRLVEAVAEWGRAERLAELGSDALLDNLQSLLTHALWGFEETERVVMMRRKLK
jgi:aminoglycoside 6'-N-acetyltransferase I